MKNILFIAPPAGGKGTHSASLVETLGYIHISTGDLLRDVDVSSELGKRIREIQSKGELVSDDIVFELLENKLKTLNGKHFLLDGCVRTLNQANLMEELLKKLGLNLDLVIELDVPYDVLLKRATGRLNCPSCNAIYNKYFKQTKVDGICDKCGNELVSRNDDNEDTFKVRFETYQNSTMPLIDYYNNLGKLVKIDGINNTYENIVRVVNND